MKRDELLVGPADTYRSIPVEVEQAYADEARDKFRKLRGQLDLERQERREDMSTQDRLHAALLDIELLSDHIVGDRYEHLIAHYPPNHLERLLYMPLQTAEEELALVREIESMADAQRYGHRPRVGEHPEELEEAKTARICREFLHVAPEAVALLAPELGPAGAIRWARRISGRDAETGERLARERRQWVPYVPEAAG